MQVLREELGNVVECENAFKARRSLAGSEAEDLE
jgi:hypothetical protein